ncbi:conserved hypothetical protein [Leishmania mexicana MHOM/GT/2001/U1103]|uniref:Nucleolar pre-ribosomal-associated protein 1 C-terminal domain-containing protein n=1 Tax=Leishmania mexicana (strain MHOM/GT/2001/U1103) TaxID=929439 RepID=E9AU14_LEIMU|nr:conserved hypothetical protein [Leishmania mexicana MHOM/GT/2001/U1103]CBZ26439.1 conserved hypothetical protein [Leishmania mexicana MHOM/GT/2001/U1103]
MAFLATAYLLAGASKLPLILLSSPPLRQCSSLFRADAQQTLKPSAIERELRDPVPTVSKKSKGTASVSYAKQNEIKRRGFNAIIRWCAYHQDREWLALTHAVDTTEEITDMDSSVLRWVQESVENFSCGQSLIVLTFLCDVLDRQRNEGSVNGSTEAWSSDFVRGLCRCISLLAARSASSEQLEIQPFLILLSAAYGLHRVTHDNPLRLPPETVASLSPPPALWLALVHQVNLFCTSTAAAQPSMPESTAIEALLTTLLLFDPARCQQLLPTPDRFLMAAIAKRLDALITPALSAARQERKSAGIAAASADACLNAEVATESGLPRGVDGNPAGSAAGVSFSVSSMGVASSICLADFARIILHAHAAPPTCRVNLMEYLLCVLRHPSTFTAEERRYLPAIMSAVRSRNLCRLSLVPDYILKFSTTMEFDVLAELLGYAKRTSHYRERIYQMLCNRFQRDDGADDSPEPKLAPHVAVSLLLSVGLQLPWTLCRPLLLCSLAAVPEVLTKMQTTAGEGGASSVAVQSAGKSPFTKVPLSLDLCAIFYFLAKYQQSLDSGDHSAEAAPEARAEILQMTRALACSIDWKACTEKSLVESTRSKGNYTMISVATMSALNAYVDGRLTHQYLSDDDALEENVLFNVFVLPIMRARTHQRIKIESLPVLAKTVRLLTTEEAKRCLVTHMIRLTGEGSLYNFFAFVRFVAPLAIEFKAATAEHTALVFRQRTLSIRGTAGHTLRRANALKVHTTMLLRTVRYVLAIGALDGGNATTSAVRRETVRVWFENYLYRLAAAEKTSKDSPLAADSVTEAAAPPHPGGTSVGENSAKEVQPTAEEDGAPAADRTNEDDPEDGDDAPGEQKVDADGAEIALDAAFTTPVTDADVEEVLSLMLHVGCRQPYRVMLPIARRMAERTSMIAEDRVSWSWCTPAPATAAEGNAKVSTATLTWAEHAMNGDSIAAADDQHECSGLLSVPPLAAHFVCSVRTDSSIELPALFPALLRALLASCDIRIFHHVVFAFLVAVKRRRTVPVLSEDLQIGVIAFATLQRRLAMEQTEDSQKRSVTVLKSLASFLNHLTLALPHLRMAQLKLLATYIHRSDASAWRSNEPTLTQLECAASLSIEPAGVAPQVHVEPDDEDDASDEKDAFEGHIAAHAKLEACLLRLIPYLGAVELKQLGLAHMQRLAVFFPHVSAFVLQQLQPQLSDFSQRELLQLVAQYPPGAAEVLRLLSTTDMHASVDLNDYVTIAKRLPMQISEAIVSAHLPHMTIAWVARVLSALAARHEEVPLPLLRSLLDRVSAVAEDTSESDKSLLMMVLQGYLFFRTDRGSLTELRSERKPATGESSGLVIDDLLWALTSTTRIVGEAEQHERRELIRACCDRLLSLEHIFTLEELRSFLISYPTSLHQMREQGVVTKVEQQLLPTILATTPLQWRKLAALVHLLAEHRVLLPSTVSIILESVFTEAQLASLHEAVVMTSDSDIVSALAAVLRIATKCAETTAPGHSPFPLLRVIDLVLSVFDGVQHWLAVVTELAMATTSSLSATEETASRHLCRMLLNRSSDLNPSAFARLVQSMSRLKAWDLMATKSKPSLSGASTPAVAAADENLTFERTLAFYYERADAHSRCVLLKAIAMDTAVLRRFEAVVFAPIQADIPLLPSEDLELVLTAALQVSNEAIVEPVLDAIDSRMLPILDQCRRSAIVRLVQCHAHFNINDESVVTAALQALERQASTEVKLDVPQLLSVLQAVASLTVSQVPERLLVLCFQRLEKMAATLTPLQQYQVGRLILDLEMGYSSSVSALVLHILDSRDGARGHKQFQAMTEELCDAFEVELPTQLRASRLRKLRSKQRVKDFWSAQRKVKQEAMLHRC